MPFYIYRGDNFMNNLFKRSLMLALTLCLMLVCFSFVRITAAEIEGPLVDFDSFTTGTNYQSTVTEGPDNAKWTVYYGTFSTNDALTGTASAQMRLYNNGNLGYAQMNYDVANVTKVTYKAKVSNTNLKLDTFYSTDSGTSWTAVDSAKTLTTSAKSYTINVSNTGDYENVRIKFAVSSSSTKPSSSNYKLIIDDVQFYVIDNSITGLDAPTNVSLTGSTLSFTSVTNASKYEILLYQDGTNDITISNLLPSAFVVNGSTYSYELPSLSGEIDYTVKVKAIGDNVAYSDSDYSSGVALNKEIYTSGYNKDSMGYSTYTNFTDIDAEVTISGTTMVLAPDKSVSFENAVKSVDKVVVRAQTQCDLTLTTNTSVEPISEKKSTTYIYTYNMNDITKFMIENNGASDAKLYQLVIYYTYPEGLHNISYVLNGGTNAVGNPTTYETGEGTTAISPATKYGFEFNGWYTNSGFNGDAVTEISNLNTENITLYAKFTELAWHKFLSLNTVGSLRIDFTRINIQNVQGYFLVEDVSDLSVGDQIIIAASGSNNAMGTENANNIGRVEISKVGKQLTYTTTPLILTLVAGSKNNTFALYDGEHYLYAGSSSSNYLKSDKTEVDDNASFAITITNSEAAIVAQGNYTRNIIRFNSSNNPNIFSCYGSGQQPVAIYKYVNGQTCDYQFNQVDMRFGVDKVTTALYNELGNSVEYGIAAVQASSYDVEQGSTTAPTNYIICTNVADVEGGKTFALLMQNIPQQARSTVITARAFVKIDGKYYYANAATYSVKTLAAEYVSPSADKSGYLNEVGMLQALSE